jgi:hypothetical protein
LLNARLVENGMPKQEDDDRPDVGKRERRMTVAVVHEQAAQAVVKFLESARIYRLPRTNPCYARALHGLVAAAASGKAVRVRFAAPNSDLIEDVRANG